MAGADTPPIPLPYSFPQDHADLRSHFFTVGMKLEAVNMREPFHICPASVTKVGSQKRMRAEKMFKNLLADFHHV